MIQHKNFALVTTITILLGLIVTAFVFTQFYKPLNSEFDKIAQECSTAVIELSETDDYSYNTALCFIYQDLKLKPEQMRDLYVIIDALADWRITEANKKDGKIFITETDDPYPWLLSMRKELLVTESFMRSVMRSESKYLSQIGVVRIPQY